MKVNDLVHSIEDGLPHATGIVIEVDVNMWGEEVIPSGKTILWSNGEIETVYEDEIVKVHSNDGVKNDDRQTTE